ncbi:NUDIX hydrolase [Fibrella forsythiae]|uniref:NUDIX hydrolase n=1 Tax=Fibrella forsythiae TaxID=2817061 RepID=A0ABS3JP09_9BACT|nr:NUDIX hydrolase [Fibrella forsythiae]MBO0951741.1 NUDIX hydrolase [Fibrella forsythiae]
MTPLLTLLQQHKPADDNEAEMTARTIAFVEANPNCLERSLLEGHITGSAWILSAENVPGETSNEPQVLLIHHRKLDRWFQPGGHADGDPDVAAVALREAQEETLLTDIQLVSPAIFDVDIHPIPAKGDLPEHLHYDIRFLLTANREEALSGEKREVKGIRWVSLDEADQLSNSESISRMVRKTRP